MASAGALPWCRMACICWVMGISTEYFFAKHCGDDLRHAQQRAFFNAFGGGDDDGIWLQLAASGDFLKDGAAMV